MIYPCPSRDDMLLDCGHDDYFSTAPRPGTYLATHWNLAASQYLLGATDNTAPPPPACHAAPAMLSTEGGATATRWTYVADYDFEVDASWTDGAYAAGGAGDRYVAADVDGDGQDDAVAAYQQSNGSYRMYVWPGATGAPSTWYSSSGGLSLAGVVRLVAGDFDGDGRDDVAFLHQGGPGTTARMYRFLSTGSAFAAPVVTWSGSYDTSRLGGRLAAADVDGDGRDDVVGVYAQATAKPTAGMHVWLAAATFQDQTVWGQPAVDLSTVGPRAVAGDFNSDGLGDVVLYQVDRVNTQPPWWRSNGTSFEQAIAGGTVDRTLLDATNAGGRLAVADVDGDHVDDVVMGVQDLGTGRYTLEFWPRARSWAGQAWYRSPTAYDLQAAVAGRFAAGCW